MASVKTLTVTVGRTVNLQNYNSIRFEISEEVSLDPGDSQDVVYRETYTRVASRVADLVSQVTGR